MDSMPSDQIRSDKRDLIMAKYLRFNWQHAAPFLVNHWPQDWSDLITRI